MGFKEITGGNVRPPHIFYIRYSLYLLIIQCIIKTMVLVNLRVLNKDNGKNAI